MVKGLTETLTLFLPHLLVMGAPKTVALRRQKVKDRDRKSGEGRERESLRDSEVNKSLIKKN